MFDLKDDLEHGDSSIAVILQTVKLETQMRVFIGRELSEKANGRYSIPQEEELADAKKADLRFHSNDIDGPIPVELKLADITGRLVERLETHFVVTIYGQSLNPRHLFTRLRGIRPRWSCPKELCISRTD